jgi:hypothetical protein
MVYYGNGFQWTELYNMPIWLRKFYLKKLEETKAAEKKAREETAKSVSSPSKKVVRKK